MLSIALPVKLNDYSILDAFVKHYFYLLRDRETSELSVVYSGKYHINCLPLIHLAQHYEMLECSLPEARKKAISFTTGEYVWTADIDNFLPLDYFTAAINILKKDPKVKVVAVDYTDLQGHYAIGTAVFDGNWLRANYSWKYRNVCECCSTWKEIRDQKFKIETLPIRAIHKKSIN